jgi:hypothetical protein
MSGASITLPPRSSTWFGQRPQRDGPLTSASGKSTLKELLCL